MKHVIKKILPTTLLILPLFLFNCTSPDANPCSCDAGKRVQFHVNASLGDGEQNDFLIFDVPDGKLLLIKHLSADVRLPKGQRAFIQLGCSPALDPSTGGVRVHHRFPLTPQGTNMSTGPGIENHLMAQVTDLFCDKELSIVLVRGPAPSPSGIGGGRIAISGWLVDLPTQ